MSIDDKTAISELDELCGRVDYAESRLNTANEVASDDDVDSAQEDVTEADEALRTRAAEIGKELFERGGEDAMRTVLDQVDPKHRATVSVKWEGIGSWTG